MTIETGSLILSGIALLFGGGVGWRLLAHSNRQAVLNDRQERMRTDLDKTKDQLSTLQTQQALTGQRVEEINTKLSKLELLEVIHTNVEHLKVATANMLPRPEAEARIKGIEDRVDTISAAVFHHK